MTYQLTLVLSLHGEYLNFFRVMRDSSSFEDIGQKGKTTSPLFGALVTHSNSAVRNRQEIF